MKSYYNTYFVGRPYIRTICKRVIQQLLYPVAYDALRNIEYKVTDIVGDVVNKIKDEKI